MLLFASLLLSGSAWVSAPSCPPAFTSVNTTIGAISNSAQLTLCAADAILINGSNGSVSLVLGTSSNPQPRCLVYPNGLSMDLTYGLLSTGHTGCWSLYPPTQLITIVNLGKPSQIKLQSALKNFRPSIPRIIRKPTSSIYVGNKILLSSSAKTEVLKSKLLSLPVQIRFRPAKYRWQFSQVNQKLMLSSKVYPEIFANNFGDIKVALSVSYSVEYIFTGLTAWNTVKPDITLNAIPISISVGSNSIPPKDAAPPRLVNTPCLNNSTAWRC